MFVNDTTLVSNATGFATSFVCVYVLDVATREPPVEHCLSGEFTCDDGSCIDASLKCDRKYDCPDGTDEFYCGAFKAGLQVFLFKPAQKGKLVSFGSARANSFQILQQIKTRLSYNTRQALTHATISEHFTATRYAIN